MHFKKNCFYGGKYFHGMYVNASMIKKYVEASMPKENVWKNGDFFKLFHAATTVNLHSTTIAFYEWIHVLLEVRFLLGLELSQLLRRNSHPMIHTLKKAVFEKQKSFFWGIWHELSWIPDKAMIRRNLSLPTILTKCLKKAAKSAVYFKVKSRINVGRLEWPPRSSGLNRGQR